MGRLFKRCVRRRVTLTLASILASPPTHVAVCPPHPDSCLDGPEVWVCSACKTHLSSNDQIISKQFTGRGGRAFLFDRV